MLHLKVVKMNDQQVYKSILQKVIKLTNNDQIHSSEQLIHVLVNELDNHEGLIKSLSPKNKISG